MTKFGAAVDRSLLFSIWFALDVKKVYRLSRLTGRVEHVEVTDGALKVRLPGGTGDLYRYGNGKFPG